MNGKDLFNAIGDISDDLILEASNPAKKMRRVRMSRAAVIAAAVIMLFGITAFAASMIYGQHSDILQRPYARGAGARYRNRVKCH